MLYSSSFKPSPEAGFSLLELAIVLVILGMIGSLSLPLLTAHKTRTALLKTQAHQTYVVSALAAYVEKNRRFPCPGEAHKGGDQFGLAQESCRRDKARGIIPFKTLGISEIYARDGFTRLMTYVIEPELTKRPIDPYEERGGGITLKTEEGLLVIPPPKTGEKNPNYIAFILISHGESGIGAYLGNGQPGQITGALLSLQKKENVAEAFTFREGTDDIVRWESRDQFLKHYVEKGK